MKKHIITCSDGTWNKPGVKDHGKKVQTNVEKMFNSICKTGVDKSTGQPILQVKAYDAGVGTGYTWWDKVTGGITGAGLDKNIKDMYSFICMNYKPGDEIYLFGFSRGAYTARSIAGFIRNCGILKPDFIHLVDKAYELYRDRNEYSKPWSDMMTCWRANYAVEDETYIQFIGVWDTVGSLGIPLPFYARLNKEKYKFHDCTLNSYVRNAYHALAVDERRKLFRPTLWEKSKTVLEDENHPQQMEQRWFAGVHSDVGGGYPETGLSDIALEWLMNKAAASGLCYDDQPRAALKGNPLAKANSSYTMRYWLWRPVWRSIELDQKKYNQIIDESVWTKFTADKNYRPENLKPLQPR